MVQTVWNHLPDHYPGVDSDGFVVLPNHVHGIIILAGEPVGSTPRRRSPVPRVSGGPPEDGCPLKQAQGTAPTGS